MQLALTGDTIDAQEAYRIGLVNKVVPLPELMPSAEAIARSIIQNGPHIGKIVKESILGSLNTPIDQGMRMAALLYDVQTS